MTTQMGDLLTFNNEKYRLACAPFFQYLNKHFDDYKLHLTNTALIKRHYCEWTIEDNKLFLTHLNGWGKVFNKDKFLIERRRLRKLLKECSITTMQNGHLLKKHKKEECWTPIVLSLQELFHKTDMVFCDWYTGFISVDYGDIIEEDFSFGIFSKYSKTRTFEINNGVVIDITEKLNTIE